MIFFDRVNGNGGEPLTVVVKREVRLTLGGHGATLTPSADSESVLLRFDAIDLKFQSFQVRPDPQGAPRLHGQAQVWFAPDELQQWIVHQGYALVVQSEKETIRIFVSNRFQF